MELRAFFRAGVGAVITDGRGKVLVFERSDSPGSWQFPQGGLDPGEEPAAAVLREVEEETGIRSPLLRLLVVAPEPLSYELPVHLRNAKLGRGQTQYWYLFRLLAPEAVGLGHGLEFRRWRWVSMEESVGMTVEFRRSLYRRLLALFAGHIIDDGQENQNDQGDQ